MTDADVDGSTFAPSCSPFMYRQMPELIENGHLYIAQPPLYKARSGRQERYVKDDAELDRYLLELGMADARVHPGPGADGAVAVNLANGGDSDVDHLAASDSKSSRRNTLPYRRFGPGSRESSFRTSSIRWGGCLSSRRMR